jgi:uncharacterized repeat protein (TIGR01451 family)
MYPMTYSWRRTVFFLTSLALSVALLVVLSGLLYAQEGEPSEPLDNASFRQPLAPELYAEKTVNHAQATAGSELHYTLVISNAGDTPFAVVGVTDTLPSDLTYVSDSFVGPAGGSFAVAGNVLIWSGELFAQSEVILQFDAVIAASVEVGTVLENTVEVSGDDQHVVRTASTTVVEETGGEIYLPLVSKPYIPPAASASATLPTSANQWTLNWTITNGSIDELAAVEVHESQSPTFDSYVTLELSATARSTTISHPAGPNNEYYYRVVPVGPWGAGAYSNVVKVVGNYYDDFSNPATGWKLRRSSLLEKMYAYYSVENGVDVFIALVDDRYDWLLASPLRPAPAVPYKIEYRARVHDASNLVSGGIVYGGDWNGGECPQLGTLFFTGRNCFNQFYVHNYIFYGPLKLQWEKINELRYCPDCGGSALKREGDFAIIDAIIPGGQSVDWNDYRVEVRNDGVRLYINGAFIRHFTDTQYVNQPYFGVFASTFEYKPAIWFFDTFRVTRMD